MLTGGNLPGLVGLQTRGLLDLDVATPVRDAGIHHALEVLGPRAHWICRSQQLPLQASPTASPHDCLKRVKPYRLFLSLMLTSLKTWLNKTSSYLHSRLGLVLLIQYILFLPAKHNRK